MLKRAGLKRRGLHCLRHTHASNLIAIDMHPKLIIERLGHKPIKITMDRYGHLMQRSDEKMRSALEELQAQLT